MADEKPPVDQPDIVRSTAEDHPLVQERKDQPAPTPGLSQSPGLVPVPDSHAPATASGEAVAHVFGPQQAACDPVAAGLDTRHDPLTRAENRMINRTGEIGSGNHPSTYVEKGKDLPVAVSDGSLVPAAPDSEAGKNPGPTGA